MFETHKEFKQQVVVWILVLKTDRALFLQMDSIDERDCAFISVGLQIVSLRHPGRAAKNRKKLILHNPSFSLSYTLLTHLLQLSLSSPLGLFSTEVARLLNPAGMVSHWSKRMPLPRE